MQLKGVGFEAWEVRAEGFGRSANMSFVFGPGRAYAWSWQDHDFSDPHNASRDCKVSSKGSFKGSSFKAVFMPSFKPEGWVPPP